MVLVEEVPIASSQDVGDQVFDAYFPSIGISSGIFILQICHEFWIWHIFGEICHYQKHW
jgi:hypothetical protein